MKTVILSVVFLLIAGITFAEQRVVTVYTQYQSGGGSKNTELSCKQYCLQNGNINAWLNKGWRVIGMNPAEIINDPFNYPNTWCRCTGTEYILER